MPSHHKNQRSRGTVLIFLLIAFLTLACRPATPVAVPAAVAGTPTRAATGPVTYTDRAFNYQITVPGSWGRTDLQGGKMGIDEWPRGSAVFSNAASPSLQSPPPDAAFLLTIRRQPASSEAEVLAIIAYQVTAEPPDILRRSQGKWLEFYTASLVRDRFDRQVAGRWFWDGQMLLSATATVRGPNSPFMEDLETALASVQLLNQ